MASPKKAPARQMFCRACNERAETKELFSVHLASAEHRQAMAQRERERNHENPTNGVRIKGLVPGYDEASLHALVRSFGNTVYSSCPPRRQVAMFVFQHASSANAIISPESLEFDGKEVTVRRWKSKRSQPQLRANNFLPQLCEAVSKIDTAEPFEAQLAELERCITDDQSVRHDRTAEMFADIETTLSPLYPGMILHPFGSTVTGLAFIDSDVDLFVELPYDDIEVINRVTYKLRHAEATFSKVVPVSRAKTPLVKFDHVSTTLSCDASFKNSLGVRNSQLVLYYISLDPRVKPLMIAVKLWGKLHGITAGRGSVTSYTLVIMVVFLLQQYGIVPPVAELQRNGKPVQIIDGWICSFGSAPRQSEDDKSLHFLVTSFFHFYGAFKWEEFVVCPLLGRLVNRSDLLDTAKLPAEMAPLKAKLLSAATKGFQSEPAMAICIQDPFVLDHNLTRGLAPDKAREFVNLLTVSSQAVLCLPEPQTTLPALLAPQILGSAKALSMVVGVLRLTAKDDDDAGVQWAVCAWRLLVRVLKSVFKMRVTRNTGGRTVVLMCHGYHDVIPGRGRIDERLKKEDPDGYRTLSPIARQVAISDRLLGSSVVKINAVPMKSTVMGDGSNKKVDKAEKQIAEVSVEDIEKKILQDKVDHVVKVTAEVEVADVEKRIAECTVADVGQDISKPSVGDVDEGNSKVKLDDFKGNDSIEETDTIDKDTDNHNNGSDEEEFAAQAGSVEERYSDFLQDIDFEWDSELIDPIGCAPLARFTVKLHHRRGALLHVTLKNNGTLGRFMPALGGFIKRNVGHWIAAEMEACENTEICV